MPSGVYRGPPLTEGGGCAPMGPNTKNAARQREGCARAGPAHDIRGSDINRAAQGRQTRDWGDVTRGEVSPPRGSVGTSTGMPGLDLARKLGSVQ